MIGQDDIYVPQDERTLRRIQRRVQKLESQVHTWAREVMELLPRGLGLLDDELYIVGLFLAQQRRLNLELDARSGEEGLRARLSRILPFLPVEEDEEEVQRVVHRTVAARIESDIQRACDFFCRDHNLPYLCDPVMDWRVAMRYMAQELHRIASQIDLKREGEVSPYRFELALAARDLAAEIVAKRKAMLTLSRSTLEPSSPA